MSVSAGAIRGILSKETVKDAGVLQVSSIALVYLIRTAPTATRQLLLSKFRLQSSQVIELKPLPKKTEEAKSRHM